MQLLANKNLTKNRISLYPLTSKTQWDALPYGANYGRERGLILNTNLAINHNGSISLLRYRKAWGAAEALLQASRAIFFCKNSKTQR
jgi:hypothetical protein